VDPRLHGDDRKGHGDDRGVVIPDLIGNPEDSKGMDSLLQGNDILLVMPSEARHLLFPFFF